MIFITVINPRGREFYVNGVYDNPRGPTPSLVTLNDGAHVIETLTSDGKLVDFEGFVDNVSEMGSVTIDLTPVVPPKRKGT